jgi:hypothetical protein
MWPAAAPSMKIENTTMVASQSSRPKLGAMTPRERQVDDVPSDQGAGIPPLGMLVPAGLHALHGTTPHLTRASGIAHDAPRQGARRPSPATATHDWT